MFLKNLVHTVKTTLSKMAVKLPTQYMAVSFLLLYAE